MALFTARSPLAFIADHPWAYPALEVVHVFGVALLLGNLVLLELRVWGRAAQLPVVALARLSLSIAVVGLRVRRCVGPADVREPARRAAGQPRLHRSRWAWWRAPGSMRRCSTRATACASSIDGARAQTALSLGLWIAVMICGRWIAYR